MQTDSPSPGHNEPSPTNGAEHLRLFPLFAAIFASVLILTNVLASKFLAVGPFSISGATLVFPITFIFNDILTEVYGYARSRQIIWIGMGCQMFGAFMCWLVGIWPAASFWHTQEEYDTILGSGPRVTMASLTAYFCGEFANSIVMSKMKYSQRGAGGVKQGWRFVASTMIGEGIDTCIFFPLAFAGVLPAQDLLQTMLTIYVVKVLYEVLALPLSIKLATWVKKVERTDHIDDPARTDYSPLHIS